MHEYDKQVADVFKGPEIVELESKLAKLQTELQDELYKNDNLNSEVRELHYQIASERKRTDSLRKLINEKNESLNKVLHLLKKLMIGEEQ